jgi:hypothetical protein
LFAHLLETTTNRASRQPAGLGLSLGTWLNDPHHLVIFMGQDVAAPDTFSRFVEGRLDGRDLPRKSRGHVVGHIFDVSIEWSKANTRASS